MATFLAFASGKLMDQQHCQQEVAKYYTKDAIIDNRGPKDNRVFKKYGPGYEGICEFFIQAPKFYNMSDLQLKLHAKGGKVSHIWNFVPFRNEGGKNKMASGHVTQYNDITLNEDNSRITGVKAFFSRPELFDELSSTDLSFSAEPELLDEVNTAQMDKVNAIFGDMTSGAYFGKNCKKAVAPHWTNDASVNITGWSESEMFYSFEPGLDGVCKYYQKQAACARNNMTVSMYGRGDDVVPVMKFVPGYAGLAISADEPVTTFSVYRFNKDKSKVRSMNILIDKPEVFDELDAKPEAKAAREALKNEHMDLN